MFFLSKTVQFIGSVGSPTLKEPFQRAPGHQQRQVVALGVRPSRPRQRAGAAGTLRTHRGGDLLGTWPCSAMKTAMKNDGT